MYTRRHKCVVDGAYQTLVGKRSNPTEGYQAVFLLSYSYFIAITVIVT